MHANNLWCPVCDAGWVEQVTITPGLHEGMLCAECEAYWAEGETISPEHFTQFSTWIADQGIAPDELEVSRDKPVD